MIGTSRTPASSGASAASAVRDSAPVRTSATGRWIAAALSLLLVAVVALVDRASGNQISFSLFYVVPVAAAAWSAGRRVALAAALLAATLWIVDRYDTTLPSAVLYWNALAETAMYTGIALAVSELRRDFDRRAAVAAELAAAYGRLDHEMHLVADLQAGLLPERLPQVPGARIAVHYAPCERSGGDYFDFFELPGGRLGVLVADASGHGAPAAVLMAMTRILLHTHDLGDVRPDQVIDRLHRDLCGNLPDGHFVTACYAVFDPADGSLAYAIAGHPLPFVVRHAGGLERLENPSGMPLGVPAPIRFETMRVRLDPGDTVVFYTDGLTEARDASDGELGEAPLAGLLLRRSAESLAELLGAIVASYERHTAGVPAADDMTIVLLRAEALPAAAV